MNYKNIANKILGLVFSLFLLSIWFRYVYRDVLAVEMFYTVMEAAFVGGVADWFAITAIFKRPLGFPWHTELIPRHRDRVILAIGNMIEQDLLSIKSIKQRINSVCFVKLIIEWVDYKDGRQLLRRLLDKYSRDILINLDPLVLAGFLENFIKTKISEVKITPLLKVLTKWGLEQEKDKYLALFILDELINRIQRPDTKEIIYQYIENIKQAKTKSLLEKTVIWLGEQTNSVNVSDATDVMYQELLNILQEMKSPEHILHEWIHAKLIEIVNPDNEIHWAEEMEQWKNAVTERAEITEMTIRLSEYLIDKISTTTYDHLLCLLYNQAEQQWERFKSDHEMRHWLETRIKKAMFELVEKEHYLIGTIVQEVLSTFTDEDFNRFIEEKAGNDLQWIRINGCIVGAIVGFIMFIFLHYFYDQNIVPIVQSWVYGG